MFLHNLHLYTIQLDMALRHVVVTIMVSHHMTQYHKYNLITQQQQGMIPKPQSLAQKPTMNNTGITNLHRNFQEFSKKYSTSVQRTSMQSSAER